VEVAFAFAAAASLVALWLAMRWGPTAGGRHIWLVFSPALVKLFLPLWAALVVFEHAPVLAVLIGLGGGILFLSAVRAVARAARATATARDPVTAMDEPFADFFATSAGLILAGGLVAVAALVALAILNAA
jgi:hypothetical protein